jgi:hypothetical protein
MNNVWAVLINSATNRDARELVQTAGEISETAIMDPLSSLPVSDSLTPRKLAQPPLFIIFC